MKATDIIIGMRYTLIGNIINGRNADGTVRLSKENVTRKVTRMTDTRIYCECGRVFVIDKDLKVEQFNNF